MLDRQAFDVLLLRVSVGVVTSIVLLAKDDP